MEYGLFLKYGETTVFLLKAFMSRQFPISSDHSSLLNITPPAQVHHLSTLMGRGSGWAFVHLVPVFISLVHFILYYTLTWSF